MHAQNSLFLVAMAGWKGIWDSSGTKDSEGKAIGTVIEDEKGKSLQQSWAYNISVSAWFRKETYYECYRQRLRHRL